MRTAICLLLIATPVLADDPAVTRLAGVSFTVADLDKAKQFYTDVLGFEQAFDLKDSAGKTQSVFLKVNDDQFLEFSRGDVENFRLDRVTLLATDLPAVAAALKKQGIATGDPAKGPDGNESFTIRDPDRTEIRFVRYLPGSQQSELRGKGLSDKRVSD